jgi:hypothetical protein
MTYKKQKAAFSQGFHVGVFFRFRYQQTDKRGYKKHQNKCKTILDIYFVVAIMVSVAKHCVAKKLPNF